MSDPECLHCEIKEFLEDNTDEMEPLEVALDVAQVLIDCVMECEDPDMAIQAVAALMNFRWIRLRMQTAGPDDTIN